MQELKAGQGSVKAFAEDRVELVCVHVHDHAIDRLRGRLWPWDSSDQSNLIDFASLQSDARPRHGYHQRLDAADDAGVRGGVQGGAGPQQRGDRGGHPEAGGCCCLHEWDGMGWIGLLPPLVGGRVGRWQ